MRLSTESDCIFSRLYCEEEYVKLSMITYFLKDKGKSPEVPFHGIPSP